MKNRAFILTWWLFFASFASSEATEPVYRDAINFDKPLLKTKYISNSKTLKFSQFYGKVIYLDFWASWCKPCLKSMPLLNQLRNKYLNQGFEVIAVNQDHDINRGQEFLNKLNIDYPVVSDSGNELSDDYQVTVIPTAIIIDSSGKIINIHKGFKESDILFLEAVIENLLSEIQ